jgi:hypothetical protein
MIITESGSFRKGHHAAQPNHLCIVNLRLPTNLHARALPGAPTRWHNAIAEQDKKDEGFAQS